jgi:hypothetical protein
LFRLQTNVLVDKITAGIRRKQSAGHQYPVAGFCARWPTLSRHRSSFPWVNNTQAKFNGYITATQRTGKSG